MVSTKSITFDGVSDYIDMGDVSTFQKDNTDAFSISCWAKTVATASVNTLVGKMTSAAGQRGYLMFLNASGQFEVVIRNTEITNSLRRRTVDSRLNDGGWHHFVMTYDGGGDLTLYVDGVNKSTTTVYSTLTSTILASKSLQVGAYDGNTAPFAGNIDEVAFFDDELTGNEVLDIFASARPADLIGSRALAAWWQFGENVRFPTVVDMVTSVATYPNIPNEVGSIPTTNYSPLTTSIQMDGSTEYVETDGPFVGFDSTEPKTIGVWIKHTSTATQTYMCLHRDAINDKYSYTLEYRSNKVWAHWGKNVQNYENESSPDVADGQWHLIMWVDDAAGANNLYIDNVHGGGTAGSGVLVTPDTHKEIWFGAHQRGTDNVVIDYLDGQVCHGFVYNKALDSSERAAVFNSGVPADLSSVGPTGNLVYWSALGDGDAVGSGNINDLAGTNNGTYVNGDSGDFVSDVPPIRTSTDGTMTNMAAADIVQWAPGSNFSKYCYDFDGVNEYIKMGNVLGFEYTDPFSLSCWFKSTSSGDEYIISKQDGTSNYRGYSLYLTGPSLVFYLGHTGEILFNLRSVSGSSEMWVVTTDGPYNDDSWHHVVATWDGNASPGAAGATIYVDGTPATTAVLSNNLTTTILNGSEFNLGTYNNGPYDYYQGLLSDVAVYDKELSAIETQWIYNNGVPRDLRLSGAPSNLEAWWRIGDGAEQPASAWVHKVHNWVWDATATKESSTITDASHLNSPGTLYNMDATNVTTDTPGGISNYSCTFNGVDEGMYCNVSSIVYGPYNFGSFITQFTLSGWVKTSASAGWLWGSGSDAADWQGYGVFLDGAGRPVILAGRTLTSYNVSFRCNTTINDGDWHHLVVSFTWAGTGSQDCTFWIDGVEQSRTQLTSSTIVAPIGPGFSIGARGASTYDPLSGQIDEVSVWSKYFSQGDVDEAYNSGAPTDLRDHSSVGWLRGWWRMGDAYTYAGTTVNMDYQDKIPIAPGITGGYSLSMDGGNDYVVTPHSSDLDFDHDEEFSISSWVFPLGLNGYRSIWYKRSGEGISIAQYGGSGGATYDPRNTIRIYFDGVTGYYEVYPGTWGVGALPYGEWFHFVMTHDGTDATGIKCYINGAEIPVWVRYNFAFPGGDSMKNGADVWLGREAAYWLGNQDEVSAWNKALTQAEVTELYNGGDPGNLLDHSAVANLVGWWQMGDGPGNDGTMTNMASGDIIENAPRKPTVGGTKIDYYLMRGVDSACGSLTYHHWTVTGAPDFTGAQAGTLPCGGPLTDIIVEATWSVFN